MTDYYSVLRVGNTYSCEEIRQKYESIIKTIRTRISSYDIRYEALLCLTDPFTRKEYDNDLLKIQQGDDHTRTYYDELNKTLAYYAELLQDAVKERDKAITQACKTHEIDGQKARIQLHIDHDLYAYIQNEQVSIGNILEAIEQTDKYLTARENAIELGMLKWRRTSRDDSILL